MGISGNADLSIFVNRRVNCHLEEYGQVIPIMSGLKEESSLILDIEPKIKNILIISAIIKGKEPRFETRLLSIRCQIKDR